MNEPTSRHNSLHPCAVYERSLDGLRSHVGPVDAMLHSIKVHHGHVVYVRHSEGDDVVVVRVVNVYASDLNLTSIEEKLAGLWKIKAKRV